VSANPDKPRADKGKGRIDAKPHVHRKVFFDPDVIKRINRALPPRKGNFSDNFSARLRKLYLPTLKRLERKWA